MYITIYDIWSMKQKWKTNLEQHTKAWKYVCYELPREIEKLVKGSESKLKSRI